MYLKKYTKKEDTKVWFDHLVHGKELKIVEVEYDIRQILGAYFFVHLITVQIHSTECLQVFA